MKKNDHGTEFERGHTCKCYKRFWGWFYRYVRRASPQDESEALAQRPPITALQRRCALRANVRIGCEALWSAAIFSPLLDGAERRKALTVGNDFNKFSGIAVEWNPIRQF